MKILFDTNVLLRLADTNDPFHPRARDAYVMLVNCGYACSFSSQNATEFWSVATRQSNENGFGLAKDRVNEQLRWIERRLRLLTVEAEAYLIWRNLLTKYEVRGKQVHDAMLAATAMHHGIVYLLTWNVKDFKRFDAITALTPDEVLAGAL